MDYIAAKKNFDRRKGMNFAKSLEKWGLAMKNFRFVLKNSITENGNKKLYLRIPIDLAHYLHESFISKERKVFSVHNLFTGIVGDGSQEGQLPLYDIDIYEREIKKNPLYHYIRYSKGGGFRIDPMGVMQREAYNPNESVYDFFVEFCNVDTYGHGYYDYLVTPAMIQVFDRLEDKIKLFLSKVYTNKNRYFNILPEVVENSRYFLAQKRQYQKIIKGKKKRIGDIQQEKKRKEKRKISELPLAI